MLANRPGYNLVRIKLHLQKCPLHSEGQREETIIFEPNGEKQHLSRSIYIRFDPDQYVLDEQP